jgi:hypothetical protein
MDRTDAEQVARNEIIEAMKNILSRWYKWGIGFGVVVICWVCFSSIRNLEGEPLWLKIFVDAGTLFAAFATCIAAIAAWLSADAARESAKAAKDAAKEMRETSFDSFLPVLKVENKGFNADRYQVFLSNIGHGPLFDLSPAKPKVEWTILRIDVGESERAQCAFWPSEIQSTKTAIFNYVDLFGRPFQTSIEWQIESGGIKILKTRQTPRLV